MFQYTDVSNTGFYINSEPNSKPTYIHHPKNGIFMEPIMELFSILGEVGEDKDIAISIEALQNGIFLLPFDVNPTGAENLECL